MALPDVREHRLLALLSLPRSAIELGRELAADPYSPWERSLTPLELTNAISPVLRALEAQGYARNLGVFDSPKTVLGAIASDEALVAMPEAKGESYVELQSGSAAYKLREGDLWYWTVAGRDALLNG